MTGIEVWQDQQDGNQPNRLVRAWLATKSRSEHTRRAYRRDLDGWLDFCQQARLDPLSVAEEHLGVWSIWLQQQGLANATIARKLSAISGFYGWLTRRGVIAADPTADLQRPQVDPDASTTPGLTKDQALALLAAADVAKGSQAMRAAALVGLLLFTGARVSELLSADIEDIGESRGHRVISVTRKGGKVQQLVIPAPAAGRLSAYLASRPDMERKPALPGDAGAKARRPLFATSTGKRMLPDDVRRLLTGLGRKAGLPEELVKRLGPHTVRHAYATLALDAGVPLRDVQDAMGHADPRTTRRYDRSRMSLDRSPGLALAAYLA